eukprot:SAG11_NODE_1048_length_6038_cov_8.260818_7_plen_136_part_00
MKCFEANRRTKHERWLAAPLSLKRQGDAVKIIFYHERNSYRVLVDHVADCIKFVAAVRRKCANDRVMHGEKNASEYVPSERDMHVTQWRNTVLYIIEESHAAAYLCCTALRCCTALCDSSVFRWASGGMAHRSST